LVTLLGFKVDNSGREQYNKGIDQTKQKQQSLVGSIVKAQVIMAAAQKAISAGFSYIKDGIFGATMEMDEYRRQLQVFTGDADSAADTLQEIRNTILDPLVGTGNWVNAYKRLQTLGMTADETKDFLQVMGDITGGTTENFNALTESLTKVGSSGKINALTFTQLAKQGFSANDMAQGLGISVDELNRRVEAGTVDFKDLTRAMTNATKEGGKFHGNLERASNTIRGSMAILKDTISSTGGAGNGSPNTL
jgi:tape measure domain-containing protein